tara:strand:+ start:41 stop:349 length:309 start_codon:yes stop_codon:yes gene_type:complete
MKDEIQSYCTSKKCQTERTFEFISKTDDNDKIYWCKTCGNIRIPRMKPKLEEHCEHNLYCVKRQTLQFPEKCGSDYSLECGQVKKFYDKYGDVSDSEFFGSA